MLIDDKSVMLRLQVSPEFILRADEAIVAHDLVEKPVLLCQTRPFGPSTAPNILKPEVQRRLLQGVRTDVGWWEGFQSGRRLHNTFHGISAVSGKVPAAWFFELHRDGHFLAAVSEFPDFATQSGLVRCIADFYGLFFVHFFDLVKSVLAVEQLSPQYQYTATLANAHKLHFGKRSDFGKNYEVSATPLALQNLQWPIGVAVVGTDEWTEASKSMAAGLAGAYGAAPRYD